MEDKSSSSVRQQIDENLKRIYDETLKEEIPDRFKDLLAQLRAQKDTEPGTGGPS